MLRKIAVFALMLLLCGFIASFAGGDKTEIDPNIISAVAQNTAGLAEKAGLTAPARNEALNKEAIMAKAADLAVPFVVNAGQFHKDVRFSADLFSGRFFLTNEELVYSLVKRSGKKSIRPDKLGQKPIMEDRLPDKGLSFKEFFVDAKGKPIAFTPNGEEQAVTKVSYFRGNDPARWQSGLASFNDVSLGEVYPGIEVKLKAGRKNVEKIFYVSPGSDINRIRIGVAGVKRLKITKDGQLQFKNRVADLSMRAPVAWQEIDGRRREVKVGYRLFGKRLYGFAVLAGYDKNSLLVIDPALDTLIASTFLGGGSVDMAYSLALGSSGNVFVAGHTNSTDFPTTSGAYDLISSEYDCFISKLDGNLSRLLASTYLGGSGKDCGYSLALDRSENVYVTGGTNSLDFPTTSGAYDQTYNGGSPTYQIYGDAFVSKLDGNLTHLLASTYLGGSTGDTADSLALDSSGNVFLSGETDSFDFPTTPGAFDQTHNSYALSYSDVFVSKLNNDLSSLLASTFLGGSYYDYGSSLVHGSADTIFVTGSTGSPDFPSTPDAYDRIPNGIDVFISKLSSDLTSLLASSFLGGTSGESAGSLALDHSGNVYLTGATSSPDFPTTPGAYDRTYNACYCEGAGKDLFISQIDGDLTDLLASSFVTACESSSYYDPTQYSADIVVDSSNNVYVTGNFSTVAGHESFYGRIFVIAMDQQLTTLLGRACPGSAYGSESSSGTSLALDFAENVYLAGKTLSDGISTTPGAYNQTYNGGYTDAFISKLNGNSIGVTVTSPNGGERWIAGTAHDITWTSIGTVGNVAIDYSINNGVSWINIAVTANDGSYSWTVPNTLSDQCLVRVSDAAYPAVSDMSDSAFSIVNAPPQVEIISPLDNATVYGIVSVKADASDDGGVVRVEFYVDGVLKENTTASHAAVKQKIFSSGISGDSIRAKKAFADSPTSQPGAKGLAVNSQYTFSWDAMEATQGSHVLRVAAYDGLGAMGFDEVTVQVIQLKLDLQAERREIRAYSILRHYSQVGFTVDNPGIPVVQYRIMRRKGSADFALLRTIAPSELQNNQFQMQDKYLEKDISYTYRVEAYDTAGQLVGRSTEKTI